MRSRLTVLVIFGVSLVFGLLVARKMVQSRDLPREQFIEKKLRLLTYATFVGSNGPGAEIIKRFEQENNVKVEVVSSPDAGLLLERLKFGKASLPFDVVLGLDQLLIEDARSKFEWKSIQTDESHMVAEAAEATDDHFVAVDWSPLTFIYRKKDGKPVPHKIDDLLDPAYVKAFALQDPRGSTPGLQFYQWVKAVKKGEAQAWLAKFEPNVNSVSPSWSFAYGLFKKEQTRFVFTYLTSLAFHWGDEKDRSYQVVEFSEGHPTQIELAAIPMNCRECELAEKFVKSLHSEWAQKLIMTKNYMFPVIKGIEKGTIFEELPKLKTIATPVGKDLSDWDKVFPN